ETACGADIVLLVDENIGDLLLFAEWCQVHHNLFGFYIGTNQHKRCNAALNGFCCLVGAFLDLAGIPCNFKGFECLVLELLWSLGFYVTFCHNSPHSGVECSFITHQSAMM